MRSKMIVGLIFSIGCIGYSELPNLQTGECFKGTCKDGLICIGGYCQLPLNVDQSMAMDDAGRPLDLSTSDLIPGPDMTSPINLDPFLPPAVQNGCAAGHLGYELGPAYGCLSAGTGFLADACNAFAGWSPCQVLPIARKSCQDIPWAFFASYAHGHQSTPMPDASMVCSWAGAPQTDQRFIYGCGTSATVHPTYSDFAKECAGFPRILPCKSLSSQPDTTIYCPVGSPGGDGDATAVRTIDPMDGTMCCHS